VMAKPKLVIALLLFWILQGCAALRLQDAPRAQTAQEVVTLAEDILPMEASDPQNGPPKAAPPFAAMLDNLATVGMADRGVQRLLAEARREAFLDDLGDLSRDDLLEEVDHVLQQHLLTVEIIDQQVAGVLSESAETFDGAPLSLEVTLEKLEERMALLQQQQDQMEGALSRFQGMKETEDGNGDEDAVPAVDPDLLTTVDSALQAAAHGLPQDSQVLMLETSLELTRAQLQRLAATRTHLRTVQGLVRDFRARHEAYFETLMIPTLLALATREENLDRLEQIGDALPSTLRDLPGELATAGSQVVLRLEQRQTQWRETPSWLDWLTAQSASQANPRQGIEAARVAVAVALLLFAEPEADQAFLMQIAEERHRHSIRTSEINTQERILLVHQTAEALRIYYQSGLSPSQIARAFLLGSNILAAGALAAKN